MDIGLFHLIDELSGERRATSDNFDYMVFEVWVLRLGNIESYSFGSAHVEMRDNVEYSFHADKSKQKVLNFKQIMLLLHQKR